MSGNENFFYGTVSKITARQTKGRSKAYNVCLAIDGNADDELWIGWGFEEPQFYEGGEIEVEVEWNGDYANALVDTLNVIDEGEAPRSNRRSGSGNHRGNGGGGSRGSRGSGRSGGSGPRSGSGSSRGGSSGRGSGRGSGGQGKGGSGQKASKSDVDWDKKDRYIRLQSCQNTAVATVRALVEAGAVTLPSKKGDKYDAFIALVDEEAERLYHKYDELAEDGYDNVNDHGSSRSRDDEEYADDVPE